MAPLYTLLAILLLVAVFGFVVARVEGLALFAPKRTRQVAPSAQVFCADRCRTPDGRCPLTGTTGRAADCPLWKFVAADVPTSLYGNPFAHLRPT